MNLRIGRVQALQAFVCNHVIICSRYLVPCIFVSGNLSSVTEVGLGRYSLFLFLGLGCDIN